MPIEHHCIILPHHGSYMIYNSRMGDQLDGPFAAVAEATLAAREALLSKGSDPSAVMDLTNAPEPEIRRYLR